MRSSQCGVVVKCAGTKAGIFLFNKKHFEPRGNCFAQLMTKVLRRLNSALDKGTSISCFCGNLRSLLIHKQFALFGARRILLPSGKQGHVTLKPPQNICCSPVGKTASFHFNSKRPCRKHVQLRAQTCPEVCEFYLNVFSFAY